MRKYHLLLKSDIDDLRNFAVTVDANAMSRIFGDDGHQWRQWNKCNQNLLTWWGGLSHNSKMLLLAYFNQNF